LKRKLLPFFRFSQNRKLYNAILQVLNYRPKNLGLFQLALTHKSASYKIYKQFSSNNERLEFLGDSVLNTIVAEWLYQRYPNEDEGFLTKMRSKIVSRDNLNRIAYKIGLEKLVYSELDEAPCKNILGNALEAVVGALFLDCGFYKTKRHLFKFLFVPYIDLNNFEQFIIDYKSKLIEWSQKNEIEVNFEEKEYIQQHKNQPLFRSEVKISDKVLGSGQGNSKKEAQQKAAKQAFDLFVVR
jgi:ribonuclease-3